MKKYLFTIAFLLLTGFYISAQRNLLKNSDFNEQGEWIVVQHIPDVPVTVEFGSTEYEINGGDGPNLLITHVPVSEEQVFIYQTVDLVEGKAYRYHMALNNMSADGSCFWCNLFWVLDEPVEGSDIDENIINGTDAWLEDRIEDFNGLIDTFTTVRRPDQDSMFIPEFTATHYLGINFGACGGDYTIAIDGVAIMDPDLPPETGINAQNSGNINKLSFYPNPASIHLEISYNISQSSDVEIILINSLGQKVVTLDNGFKMTGTYKQSFNCSNLASGLYYGVLRTDNSILTKKIVISK